MLLPYNYNIVWLFYPCYDNPNLVRIFFKNRMSFSERKVMMVNEDHVKALDTQSTCLQEYVNSPEKQKALYKRTLFVVKCFSNLWRCRIGSRSYCRCTYCTANAWYRCLCRSTDGSIYFRICRSCLVSRKAFSKKGRRAGLTTGFISRRNWSDWCYFFPLSLIVFFFCFFRSSFMDQEQLLIYRRVMQEQI